VNQARLFVLVCVLFLIGISVRYFFAINAEDNLKNLRDKEEAFEVTGIIVHEPDPRDNHIKYVVRVHGEKILVSLPFYPKYFYQDKIKITGKFLTPPEFEDFSYKDYLLKNGIRTISYYPEVLLLERKSWTFYGTILKIKEKLKKVSQEILPYPESELFSGMFLGTAGTIPQDVKDNFSRSGLSHIVAISGMNITIIVGVLAAVLARTKFRRWSFYLISTFLFLYIVLVGMPPSAVRAGIMGGILLLSRKIHRQFVAHRALVIAGLLMLLLNPLLIRYDVGFQLSFLAVLGILELGPAFEKLLQKFLKGRANWLSEILAITLAAQVFTLPIIIWNFGIFSLISPLANIFVVPLLPFVITIGFTALLAGLISTSVGIFVAFPLYLILAFIIWLAEFSGNLKLSFIEIKSLNFFWVIWLYVLIFVIVYKFKSKKLTVRQN